MTVSPEREREIPPTYLNLTLNTIPLVVEVRLPEGTSNDQTEESKCWC